MLPTAIVYSNQNSEVMYTDDIESLLDMVFESDDDEDDEKSDENSEMKEENSNASNGNNGSNENIARNLPNSNSYKLSSVEIDKIAQEIGVSNRVKIVEAAPEVEQPRQMKSGDKMKVEQQRRYRYFSKTYIPTKIQLTNITQIHF